MQFANLTPRDASRAPGLIITLAVHGAVVAVGLIGFGVVELPAPPRPPIVATNIPDAPPLPRPDASPKTRDIPIAATVDRPEFVVVETPRADTSDTLASSGTATKGDDAVMATWTVDADPPKPVGVTRRAMLDTRYSRDFEAPYPPASQRLGETGTVLVRVIVGIDGRVRRADVAKSSGFARLDDAAVKRALAKWRFVPAMVDGALVEAEREVPVTFRLQG